MNYPVPSGGAGRALALSDAERERASRLSRHEIGGTEGALCKRCRWSVIIRREQDPHILIKCAYFTRPVPTDLVECSVFTARGELTLPEMENLAVDAGTVLYIDRRPMPGQYR